MHLLAYNITYEGGDYSLLRMLNYYKHGFIIFIHTYYILLFIWVVYILYTIILMYLRKRIYR